MQIFLSGWRDYVRQKANLFFTIFFPSILVFILGTLLEQWNIADYEIPEIKAAFVTEVEYPAFEQFLCKLEEEGLLRVVREETTEAALAGMGEEYAAVIEYDGETILLYQGEEEVSNRALHIMLQNYASMEQAVILCYQNGVQVDISHLTGDVEYVTAKKLGVERSMIDYYAVAMLVMILFMGGTISGSVSFYEFRKSGLYNRVAITPINKAKVFVMMVMGQLPMVAIEIGAIMLCSMFFFGAHYCADIVGNLVLIASFFLVAMAAGAFSAVVGLFIQVNPTAIMMPICWVMMFFSGTFAKEIYIQGLSDRMPMYLIQQAAFDLTLFGNYGRILTVDVVSILCFVIFMTIGAVLFSRKKEA